ncbi:hypothetical protein [Nocardia mangyaensis]|uniref:hypothetical protein n=1 Tax=Nocardia mangyaensis TaxID=2213200 RepID=UPI002675B2FA|nr:hypothetical protein [Nocardia mangyaensis]MDO3647317.1 hypothetical protein [Nocardia mangyaensis]
MATPGHVPPEVSIRAFVNDSGRMTRSLRDGERFVLTLNGEPLADVIPIHRSRFVSTARAQQSFVGAPALDADELRRDLDAMVDDELADDPWPVDE